MLLGMENKKSMGLTGYDSPMLLARDLLLHGFVERVLENFKSIFDLLF